MTFVTDASWTPARHRLALAAIAANDNHEPPPRKARTSSPKHAALAQQMKSLLRWRAIRGGSDWTDVADNDDASSGKVSWDAELEMRPRLSEVARELEGVEFVVRRHARLGGGGGDHVVTAGGDIDRGPNLAPLRRDERLAGKSAKQRPHAIVRIGAMRFSNGRQTERGPIRNAVGEIVIGDIPIPLGGLVDFKGRKPRDRFGAPKGSAGDVPAERNPSVSAGAIAFEDPVAEAQEAEVILAAVKPATATLLDLALRAANFKEVGAHLGYRGKAAERRGKTALIEACAELDAVLVRLTA